MGRHESSKKYYETHKEEIAEKDKARWVRYYQENKDLIKKKNLERYYSKKANAPPVQPPESDNKEERLKAIVEELRELLPKMVKAPRKRKAKNESSGLSEEVVAAEVAV